MDRPLFLCAFVSFYVPFSHSMCLPSVLWAVLSFYVPSFCSMCRPLSMCLRFVLCSVLSFNVLSFRSMDRSLIQCAFLLFYGPFSLSMSLHSILWTVLPPYEPSSHSMARPPTLCSTLAYLQNISHLVATLRVAFSIIEVKGEHGRYWEDEQIIV